ncbi:hypothetical protein [Leekyejoonella antrihumi]|uniref:Uncharacterized protein n=1 Tax=Leekyejoonella antrihumi TaxID=1660198 RepID=A0A563DUA1_9MICO|nr:hypothetical protein [Leekyejoonella antrihumi]TWP33756.1 hypothetical protein FGL98_20185 [Leekyejoonella antrihumi]
MLVVSDLRILSVVSGMLVPWTTLHLDQGRSGKRSNADTHRHPAAELLGWQVRKIEPERGEIEVYFTATETFTNPTGNIQGGFRAAMLDGTCRCRSKR